MKHTIILLLLAVLSAASCNQSGKTEDKTPHQQMSDSSHTQHTGSAGQNNGTTQPSTSSQSGTEHHSGSHTASSASTGGSISGNQNRPENPDSNVSNTAVGVQGGQGVLNGGDVK